MKAIEHCNEVTTLYDTLEAAILLHVGSDTVRQLARTGRLSHRRLGRKFLFSPADINSYLTSGKVVKATK